jgi:hypothetical protein
MGLSQLRVELVVATGIVGASLIAATFTGCQTDPMGGGGPPSNGLLGQITRTSNGQPSSGYPGAQQGAFSPSNGMGMAQNGSMQPSGMSPYAGMTPTNGMPSAPGMSPTMAQGGYDNRQSFLTEAQRVGAQQGLSAQDVVAMSRSGMSDQQIAMAIAQRGDTLRSTPGVAGYLAQNGVNPAVLNGPVPSGGQTPMPFPSQMGFPNSNQYAAVQSGAMQSGSSPYAGAQYAAAPPFTSTQYASQTAGPMPASAAYPGAAVPGATSTPFNGLTPVANAFPTAQADTGPVQPTGYDSSAASQAQPAAGGYDTSSAGTQNAMPAQAWRPMPR